MANQLIGKITHYYDKLGVAIIDLKDTLKVGDVVKFVKGTETTEQTVNSIQIERAAVDSANKGAVVGVKVDQPLKEGTEVYKA